MNRVACVLILLAVASGALGEFADYVYVPPAKGAENGQVDDTAAAVAQWAVLPQLHYVFDERAGANEVLKSRFESELPLRVADGYYVGLDSPVLFETGARDGDNNVFVVRITSQDATAVRLLADLNGLGPDDEVWVADPDALRAFGPYGVADAHDGGRWLPTIAGDTVLVVVRTPEEACPFIEIIDVSHFFIDLAKAVFPCPIEADCVSETAYKEVSTGVGMLIIPAVGGGQFQCSGALLNNPDTAELENYLLTAHHCFPSSADADQMEVFWDYRASACDGSGVPDLDTVPRSEGAENLAESSTFDGQFLRLNNVPVGARGRAWLGWDTRDPVIGDEIAGAHHPSGNPLKACFGAVTEVDVDTSLGDDQTEVHWDEGITEQGSSGSPLMFHNIGFRVLGMLSNGPVHDCANPPQNRDNFSAFRRFFPQIQCYLLAGRECEGEPGRLRVCLAKAAFGEGSGEVDALRALRDKWLAKSELGKGLINAYYAASPVLAGWLESSPAARGMFVASAAPLVRFGRTLQ